MWVSTRPPGRFRVRDGRGLLRPWRPVARGRGATAAIVVRQASERSPGRGGDVVGGGGAVARRPSGVRRRWAGIGAVLGRHGPRGSVVDPAAVRAAGAVPAKVSPGPAGGRRRAAAPPRRPRDGAARTRRRPRRVGRGAGSATEPALVGEPGPACPSSLLIRSGHASVRRSRNEGRTHDEHRGEGSHARYTFLPGRLRPAWSG
jgi:hypothetical protein